MKQVKIKGEVFNLSGESIALGSQLSFKAKDINNEDFNLSDISGPKIVSIFPDINTRICDLQTIEVSKMAYENPTINFLSITIDDVNVIKEWCSAKGISNLQIVSDKEYGEFASATNLLIVEKNKLARGFILLDSNNIIKDIVLNEEISALPDFNRVNTWISKM